MNVIGKTNSGQLRKSYTNKDYSFLSPILTMIKIFRILS